MTLTSEGEGGNHLVRRAGIIESGLANIDKLLFGRFAEQSHRLLEREVIGSCATLLDLGCGSNSPVRKFSRRLHHTVGVDGFELAVKESEKARIHNAYRTMDVMNIGKHFQPDSFDCVLAFDLIEHLAKEDGLELLAMMEQIASKKVIVYTPNGFLPQHEIDSNRYQVHLSGWEVAEMHARGYRVIGINGWKPLRGERARISWRPTYLWSRISLLSQIVTTRYPRIAFQMLCIKDLPGVTTG